MCFFSRLPRSWLGGPCFRSVDLFPPGWNGGFHLWRYSGVPLGRLLRPMVSPRSSALGAGVPGLLLLELLPPSWSGCGSSRCPSCSSHPSAAWFSSKTSASWVLTVASAPDSERAFAFRRSLCSVSSSAIHGQGARGDLPIGLVPLSALGVDLPPLWRWRAREAVSCRPIRSSGRLPGACS